MTQFRDTGRALVPLAAGNPAYLARLALIHHMVKLHK